MIAGRSSAKVCDCHTIGLDGQLVTRDPDEQGLRLLKPEADAVFRLVEGVAQQRIVCEVAGAAVGEGLWWFVDGVAVGTSQGTRPFAVPLEAGAHRICCTNEKGETAEVAVTVR